MADVLYYMVLHDKNNAIRKFVYHSPKKNKRPGNEGVFQIVSNNIPQKQD